MCGKFSTVAFKVAKPFPMVDLADFLPSVFEVRSFHMCCKHKVDFTFVFRTLLLSLMLMLKKKGPGP